MATNTTATVRWGGTGRIFKISRRHLMQSGIDGVVMNPGGGQSGGDGGTIPGGGSWDQL